MQVLQTVYGLTATARDEYQRLQKCSYTTSKEQRSGFTFNVALTCESLTVAQFQINGSVQKVTRASGERLSCCFTVSGIAMGVDLTGGTLELQIWQMLRSVRAQLVT